MPLSRYEIRSEYSLANPDLYRVADKDDPEGLLEGVAMAGLVGIIRQLGDLAEFAAEVFHDLHEDILTIAARGHELLVRVRQLEIEAPLIEEMLIGKIDDGQCYYNPGVEWHGHIYNEQNHFTQGDLPRFVRSAYEDCRSPPRLFPLDRFDVAGAGSCLKRFTDPSFFKTEWASTELMKAEKEQQDQKARRMKRKGQRQEYGEGRRAKLSSHIQFREPTEVEILESLRTTSSASDSSLGSKQWADDVHLQENDDMILASGLVVSELEGPQARRWSLQDLRTSEPSLGLKMEQSTLDTSRQMEMGVSKDLEDDVGMKEVVTDDSTSETENFMDAVTTMDSEVEMDSEMKGRSEGSGELFVEFKEVEVSELWNGTDEEHNSIITPLASEPLKVAVEEHNEIIAPVASEPHEVVDEEHNVIIAPLASEFCEVADEEHNIIIAPLASDPWKGADEEHNTIIAPLASEYWKGADEEHNMIVENGKCLIEEEEKDDIIIEVDFASANHTPEASSNLEPAYLAVNSAKVVTEGKDCSFVDGDIIVTSVQGSETSTPNSRSDTKFPGVGEDIVSKSSGEDIVPNSSGEDTASKSEGYLFDDAPMVLSVEDELSKSIEEDNVSKSIGEDIVSKSIGEDTASKSEGHLIDDAPTVFSAEDEISAIVQSAVVLAVKENLSSSISQSNASSPELREDNAERHFKENTAERHLQSESNSSLCYLEENAYSYSGNHIQSGSASPSLEAPETLGVEKDPLHSNELPDLDVPDSPRSNSSKGFNQFPDLDAPCKDLSPSSSPKSFNQIPEPDIQGNTTPKSDPSKDVGAVSTRKRWQISKLFTKEFLASDLERENLEVSGSEQGESPRKRSLQSSPSSSIQPMKWAFDSSKLYLTDDELEDMQVSTASPSSSSSTLSSPRPSTLATTLLNLNLEHKPQDSVEPFLESHTSTSPKSGSKTAPHQPPSQMVSTAEPLLSPVFVSSANSSPHSAKSSPDSASLVRQPFFGLLPSLAYNVNTPSFGRCAEAFSAQGLADNNLEVFPPPPPLPPLAWRMTKKTHGTAVNPSNIKEPSTSKPIACDVQGSPNDLLQAFTSATTSPTLTHPSGENRNELTQTFSSFTTGKPTSQQSEVMLDKSSTYESGLSDLETLPGRSADLHQVPKTAESHDREPTSFLGRFGLGSISVMATSDLKEEKVVKEGPVSSLLKKFFDYSSRVTSSKQGTVPVTVTSNVKEEKCVTEGSISTLQEKFIDDSSCSTLSKQGTSSVMATSDLKEEKIVIEEPFSSLQQKFIEDSSLVTSSKQATSSFMATADLKEEKGVAEEPVSSLQEDFVDNNSCAISSKQGRISAMAISDCQEEKGIKEEPFSGLQKKLIEGSSHVTSCKQGTISVPATSDLKEEKGVKEGPISSLQEDFVDNNSHVIASKQSRISVMAVSDFKEEKGVKEGSVSNFQRNSIDNSSCMTSSKGSVSNSQRNSIDDSCCMTSSKQGGISSMTASDFREEKGVAEGSVSGLPEKFTENGSGVPSSDNLQIESIPAKLKESKLDSQIKGGVDHLSPALQRNDLPNVLAPNFDKKEATTSHDSSRLKKRSTWAWTSSTASSDDREVLLDQIRTRSFSLRNTSREKVAPPRPVTSINVAAILEKANAIRQAFAGSDDDDDDWSN